LPTSSTASRSAAASTGRERRARVNAPVTVITARVANARAERTSALTARASDHHSGATALSRQAS
jgi:hypothetical protein